MIYDYECVNCKHQVLDVSQSIHDKPLRKCPSCGKHKLERILLSAPHGTVRGEITTLGQQGEANAKRLGKYHASDLKALAKEQTAKEKSKGAWWGSPDKKEATTLASLTPEKKQKYINTGEI